MVTRVEGTVNGDHVIFKRLTGDQWQATVPSNVNGIYIIEMTAWDEAGNIDHIAKYMLMYDPVNLCAQLIPIPYYAEVEPDHYTATVSLSDYFAELQSTSCRG